MPTSIHSPAPSPAAIEPRANDPDPEPDDATLVAAAQRDRQAFAPLYRRYVDSVYRYCYRRLGNREAAEDATSLIFAKALAALPRYRDRSFRSWLFTIAHNVIADSYRSRRTDAPLAAAAQLADATPSPEEIALSAEARRSIRDLLAQLPDDQRRIVELRLAGQTAPEIATVVGRSLASVKFAQFRAYSRLRVLLGVEGSRSEATDGEA